MKNHRFNPFRTGLAAATLTLLAAGPVWAANIWDGGGGDGFWNTATNWDNDAESTPFSPPPVRPPALSTTFTPKAIS
jgi:hypothetical protein